MRIRMREMLVEKQIQCILIYMQEGLVNIWKKNILEDLETEELEFPSVGDFLAELKKEFSEGNDKSAKVVELKKVEQKSKTMKEFV